MFKALCAASICGLASAAGGSAPYNYLQNGKDWGNINDGTSYAYKLCDDGKQQSPIDLNTFDS
jgi:carbonic anhydrase